MMRQRYITDIQC